MIDLVEETFMADFASPPLGRDQLVLFPQKLDDVIASDHPVRLLDDILDRIDWKSWEEAYVLVRGQPPIHPRVLASVILYGITKRIRTSRSLEEALEVRVDFRWLAQGRSIDHTTLSRFRTKNNKLIKELFVQIGLVARSLGHLPLASLGFDGTRMRASNRKSGSRTPEELRQAKQELSKTFDEIEDKIAQADKKDDEQFGDANDRKLKDELADVSRRRTKVDAALAEIEQLEKAGQKVPARLPITDPQSRITPNKEGGFAPNYTPTATVDIDSGLIVSAGVIPHTDEHKHMIGAVKDVVESFSLEQPPKELLADSLMSTGDNLSQCKAMGLDFYSPMKSASDDSNPALREDPTQAVSDEDIERLPTTTTKQRNGTTKTQFDKNAFIYDQNEDCYWCPAGKKLPYTTTTNEVEKGRQRVRLRYHADPQDCQSCPLKSRCIDGSTKKRTLCHEQHESLRIEHANKMAKPESKKKYSRRRHPGERPFATIKGQFGIRSFLTRGLEKVTCEWQWLTSAFNLHRLMSLISGNAGPPQAPRAS
jgi:transposase